MGRGTFVCAVLVAALFGGSEAAVFTETCTSVAARYQRSVKDAVTAVNTAVLEAKARMAAQQLSLAGSSADLAFVSGPLNSVLNYTSELTNQFDEQNDAALTALAAAVPSGLSIGCDVALEGLGLYLRLGVDASASVSKTVDLSTLPAADVAALGLSFEEAAVLLSGSTRVTGTIEVDVTSTGTVVRVAGLSVAVSLEGAVDTMVAWKDAATVKMSGSVSLSGVTVPVEFPTGSSLGDFVAKVGEVRLGSLSGALTAALAVTVDVAAVPVGQLPSPVLMVADADVFDAVPPVVTVDMDITQLQSTVVELLRQLGQLDIDLGVLGLSGLELPEVNVSKLVQGVPDALRLAPVAEQYFLLFVEADPEEYPTFAGLMQYLRENLPVPQAEACVGFNGFNVTGGWFPEQGEVALRLQMELGTQFASESFGGSISNVLGDMQALSDLFGLLGVTAPEQSLAVPDFSADVAFSGAVVLDVTLGLRTEFINTGKLTGAALASNAFVRVNDLSAAVSVAVDPINFEALLPLGSTLAVHDGSFEVALGVRSAFGAAAAEVDFDTPVTTSDVAAAVEITVLDLLSGGASAVAAFVKQLQLEVYATLDVVIPVELTSEFLGDRTLGPIVELHDETLLGGGLPKFSLDVDLSFLVPSLPGGSGGADGGELTSLFGSLSSVMDGISGISLPTASLPGVSSVGNLLKSFGGKVSFAGVLSEYLDLLVKFRQLANKLSLDLRLDTTAAEALVVSVGFNTEVLGLLKLRYPTVFVNFTGPGLVDLSGVTFSVLDYLKYVQVEFGLATTLASADATFGKSELVWFLAVNAKYSLTKENAWALVRLLGLSFSADTATGYPSGFDPAAYLPQLQAALGLSGLPSFNLGALGSHLAGSVPTLGVNVDFNLAVFNLVAPRFPDLLAKFGNTTVGDLLPLDLATGEVFDWRNFLPEVGSVLGLGSSGLSLDTVAGLFGKRPTIQGLVRYLKARLLDGLSTGLSIGGLSFGGGLSTAGGRWELTAQLGLAFDAGSVRPSEIVDSLQEALTGLFGMIGQDNVIGTIDSIGSGLVTSLAGLDQHLSFAAKVGLQVEAGMDIKPLIDGTGRPKMFLRVTQFSFEIGANVTDFAVPMDFGGSFDFESVVNGEITFSAVAENVTAETPAVLLDQHAGVSLTVAPLKDAIALGGSIVSEVQLSGGPLPAALYLGVEDLALFDTAAPKFTVDTEIPQELMQVLRDGLVAVSDVGRYANGFEALSTTLPLMNRTLNDLLKTGGAGPDWGDFLIWDTVLDEVLADPAYAGCLDGSTLCPKARPTIEHFRAAMANRTQGAFTTSDGVPASFVKGGMVGKEFQLGFRVSGDLEVRVTPPLAELIDDEDFEFSGTGLLAVRVNFGFGLEVTVDTSAGLSKVTANDILVRLDNFTVGMEIAAEVSATASIGILSASVANGTGSLVAQFAGSLAGGAVLPLSKVTTQGFDLVPAGSLNACLPFAASVGGQDLATLGGAGADEVPQLCVADADLFDGKAPTITPKHMSRLYDFRGLTPIQIMGLVRGLINVVQEYRESPVFDLPIPFTDADVGDMLDFSETMTAALTAKMVKVQDAADRPTLVLCVEGDVFLQGWNVDGTNESLWFAGNTTNKVLSLVLNEELEAEVPLNETVLLAAKNATEIAEHMNDALYTAGLALSVQASVAAEGVDALQLCTNASIKATDLRVKVAHQKTGKTAYNESEDAVAATHVLGFTDGDLKQAPRVPAFSSIPELVVVLAEAVGLPDGALTYTYGPSQQDASKYELLFRLDLQLDLPQPAATLKLGAEVEPLLEVNASASIGLTTVANVGFELGARMGTAAGNLSLQANIPAAQEFTNFTLAEKTNFTVVLDRVPHVVVLAQGAAFYDELEAQLAALSLTLADGASIRAMNYENTTFLIQTTGVGRLETLVTAEFEALTGLTGDKAKAQRFTPVVRNLGFEADMVLLVSDVNLAATLAVLAAEAYNGIGQIAIKAVADFGTRGEAMALSDIRDAIVEDPFGMIAANATVDANLYVDVSVGIPGFLSPVSGSVAVALNPPFFVELQPNFSFPNASDFVVTVDGPDIPNFRNLSVADIVGLIADGVDLIFGNTQKTPAVSGLLSDLPLMDASVPLVSVTPRTVVTQVQAVLAELEVLLNNTQGGLARIELLVEEKLGLPAETDASKGCTGSCLMEFKYDADTSVLALELEFTAAPPALPDLNLDMNLQELVELAGVPGVEEIVDLLGDFLDMDGTLAISLEGSATAKLQLGVDMSSKPFRLFVGGGTALQANLRASAQGGLSLSLGPITFEIVDAHVSLDAGTGNPAEPAYVRYGLVEGTKYYLDEAGAFSTIVNDFGLSHQGRVEAVLPVVVSGITETLTIGIPSISDFLTRNNGTSDKSIKLVKFDGLDVPALLRSLTAPLVDLNPIAALVQDKQSLLKGVDGMFNRLNLAIVAADGVLGSMDIPIVKNKIREVVERDFIEAFRVEMKEKLSAAMEGIEDTNAVKVLRDLMVELFQGRKILKGDTIPVMIKNKKGDDLQVLNEDAMLIEGRSLDDADAVEWDVTLGKDLRFTEQFDFDFGLEELPLKLNASGGVELLVGWEFKLWFGVSVSRGFYLNVVGTEMEVYADLTLPFLKADGELFILKADIENRNDVTQLLGRMSVDVGETDDDGFLTFRELKSGGAGLLRANAEFEVAVGMDMTLGLAGSSGLPRFTTALYSYYGTKWERLATAGTNATLSVAVPDAKGTISDDPSMATNQFLLIDVALDLGEFVTNILQPIFAKLDSFLAPLRPVLVALQKPLPVISDLAGRDVSLLQLPEVLLNGLLGAGGPVRGSVKNVLAYLNAIQQIIDLVIAVTDVIKELATWTGTLKVSFGNWQLLKGGFTRLSPDAELPAGYTGARYAVVQDDDVPVSGAATTGSDKMRALMRQLTDPDAVFSLPFLSANGVLGLITGKDVDLFVVQTPQMEIDVTIDFWFPVAAGIVVIDFYGSFQFRARVSVGYDTSGIRRAIEQSNPALALDGFYLSDTDKPTGTGGVDIPELYSAGRVRIGATLNLFLARLSASGEFSFTGSIDLYDPNDDGKIRFSEIKSIIEKGSFLDIFNIKIKMCAGASFSVELFNPFVNWKCAAFICWPRGRWESVWKFSTSVCFLDLDTTPPALPVLAEKDSSNTVLLLNMGTRASSRDTGDTSDKGEYFTIRHVNGAGGGSEEVEVLFGTPPAAGQDDTRQAQEFSGFLSYEGHAQRFSDTVLLVNPVSRGTFTGGDDGGQETDRLILDLSTKVTEIPAGTLAAGQITGFGLTGEGILYSEFEEVHIYLNGAANTVTVTGLAAGTKLYVYLAGGNDKVIVRAGAAVAGAVTLVGGDGQDTLYVEAQTAGTGSLAASPRQEVGGVAPYEVVLDGMPGSLDFVTMDVVRVTLTGGADDFTVAATPAGASIEVKANGGTDTVRIGGVTVNDIVSPVKVSGSGAGTTMVIDDSLDTQSGTNIVNVGGLTSTRVSGLGMSADGILYSAVGSVEVHLARRMANTFTTASTHTGNTAVYGGEETDELTVSGSSGPTQVYAGKGEDRLVIPVTMEGDTVVNRIAGLLLLDGGDEPDAYEIGYSGTGQSRITLNDTGYWNPETKESNTLVINGTPDPDLFLFRKNFIALIHTATGAAERIDIDASINGGIAVNGLAGDDTFVTDGTSGITTQNGGAGDDRFLIGQLWNSERVAADMSEPGDAFGTTLTTEGWLSDGNGEHMNCNGESGEDTFVVMRNVGTLSLRGGVGNDRFTVRAFALADAEDQTQPDPAVKQTDVSTDEGDDVVYYTVNAPVSIDGGPGFDTLVAIGTNLPDTFVITRDGIYGAGLYVTFTGIESVELNTAAGDDAVYVMSTAAHVKTSVFAGLGSDTVYVTPRYSVPVQSSDLRGHNGVIEHALSSATDAAYDGLEAHGVTAYVTDADNASIALVVPTELVLLEGGSASERVGTYTVRMAHPVTGRTDSDRVDVTIVAPAPPSEIPNAASVTVSPAIVSFNWLTWFIPKTVTVTVVQDGAVEGGEVAFLGHAVSQLSNTDGYNSLKIPSVPVRVVDEDQAEIYILETLADPGMRVSESGLGDVGTSVTYDVLLQPCVADARPQDVAVNLRYDTAQVTASPASVVFDTSTGCRQTVTVTAINDDAVEGFHFVALNHDVVVSGSNIVYSGLAASAVNVEIVDDDAPGLVVLESGGSTEVIEGVTEDTYKLYLTQAPIGEVTVDAVVQLSQVWGKPSLAAKQVTVSPASVVFNATTYAVPVTITVAPIGDETVDQGEATQQFASQPALAYQIQGALTVGGGEAPGSVSTLKAISYPGEVDLEAFPGQTNLWLTVREEQQVDRLVVENTGGFLPTTVALAEGRITGMGMGETRVLAGETVLGGISYVGMEEVVVNLGPAVDTVVVNGTHPGATYVNAGKGNDAFTVLAADGPVVLDGADGNDTFVFGDGLVSGVQDVVSVAGGAGTDTLHVNNTQGNVLGDAGFLTRTELTGLGMYPPPRDSGYVAVQVVAVRGTGGTFTLSFSVDAKPYELEFAVGTDGAAMASAMHAAVFPDTEVCGTAAGARCAQSFAVDRVSDEVYLVRYTGEMAAVASISTLSLDTANVIGASEELLNGERIDARTVLAGLVYTGVESLDIDLSTAGDDTLNVRGTSVPTVVRLHAGDDTVAVGSDAVVLSNAAAVAVMKVEGRADYVEALLTVDGGEPGTQGRKRLLVADTLSTVGRTNVTLTAGRIAGVAPADIVYTGPDYTRGITVWLGAHADTVLVAQTYGGADGVPAVGARTVTSVFTGDGADNVTVALSADTDGFCVVGTEEGDDTLDASQSTLPLVLLGGAGADTIMSGLAADIIFGDTGRAVFGGVDTVGVPAGSTPALSGVAHLRSSAFTDHCAAGGRDTITTTGGVGYVAFGGADVDVVATGPGEDAVFGDYGYVEFTEGLLTRAESACESDGGDDVLESGAGADVVAGGNGADKIMSADGADVVAGDHMFVLLSYASGARLVTSVATTIREAGAGDFVWAGSGDDVVLGGAGNDTVWGGTGVDVVFGDAGSYTSAVAGDFAFASTETDVAEAVGAGDVLFGEDGDDILLGGQGADTVWGADGNDWLFGDHGSGSVAPSISTEVRARTQAPMAGGADTVHGEGGHDVLFGGHGEDTLLGADGSDVLFGNYGEYTADASSASLVSVDTEYAGEANTIDGAADDDFVFGGSGSDTITGADGADWLFGDHGQVDLQWSAVLVDEPMASSRALHVVPVSSASGSVRQAQSIAPASGLADEIAGGDGADYVFGGGGGDALHGDNGSDVLFGDHGSVQLNTTAEVPEAHAATSHAGYGGDDTIDGDDGDDVIFGGAGGDVANAGTGNDVVFGDYGEAHVIGAASEPQTYVRTYATQSEADGGADTLSGHDGADYLFGGPDGDNITGDAGDDWVFGDNGQIRLVAATQLSELLSLDTGIIGGADSVATHAGDDVVLGGEGEDTVDAGADNDVVFGDHGNATFTPAVTQYTAVAGAAGAGDAVVAGEGDDLVFGGQGADEVDAGAGNDVVFGDDGQATLVHNSLATRTYESVFTEVSGGFGGADTVVAGTGDDIVFGGHAGDKITGDAGDDWLFGDHGRVALDTLVQVLESTAEDAGGADLVHGSEGDDYIIGGVGADTLHGGEGQDFVFGDNGKVEQPTQVGVEGAVRTFTPVFPASAHGGDDTIYGGDGDDVVVAQQGGDYVEGNAGMDMVFGDQAEAVLARADHAVVWAHTVLPTVEEGLGGDDELHGGAGEDYLFGGTGSDTLHGGDEVDVLLGDHALFNRSFPAVHQYRSIYTGAEYGAANDTLHGDGGDDMILGQQGADTIFGGAGEDDITGGHDVLGGVDGGDHIFGDSEADVVLGDNGVITRRVYVPKPEAVAGPATPVPVQRPLFCDDYTVLQGQQQGKIVHPAPEVGGSAGPRPHYGPNEHKCWQTACNGKSVKIDWHAFATEDRYDMVSLYTASRNGTLELVWERSGWTVPADGTYAEDVLVRFASDGYQSDLGFMLEYTCSTEAATPVPTGAVDNTTAYYAAGPPYVNGIRWERYPGSERYADIVRLVQRFDDVDLVQGDDVIDGGEGDDVLHGQRGDDELQGGAGDDEVFGEMGSDVVRGGEGADVLLGDMGHVVRAFTEAGLPRANTKTGAWHRDVVLEEHAQLTEQWVETWHDTHFWAEDAARLLRADLLVALGGYEADGAAKLMYDSTRGPWKTAVAGLRLLEQGGGNDTLDGEGGDDVLFGQRGNDLMSGGSGDDFVYGDRVSSVYHYDSCLPLVTTVVRTLPGVAAVDSAKAGEPARVAVPAFGYVVHVPMWLEAEQSGRAGAMRPVDDAALVTVMPESLAHMLDAVGAADWRLVAEPEQRWRPFVAAVPDVARHAGVVFGNDDLDGGDGNDVVVGDSAFHHALVNVKVAALDEMRERTAARWGEVQFRLARLSVDVGTLEAQTGADGGVANVSTGNDRVRGGAGDDTLVGDRLEAFTDVVYHTHFGFDQLEATVKGLMRAYFDFEVLAVDLHHALFEAHHRVVESLLYDWRNREVGAPEVRLEVSNDEMHGGDGNDVVVGDSLLVVSKGMFRNATHSANHFTAVDVGVALPEAPFKELLNTLKYEMHQHIRKDYHLSDYISGGNLKRRFVWDSLPRTRWGCDTLHGDAGDDTVLGDYGLVVVATFEGAPFHPSTVHGLRSINTALAEHLDYVEDVLRTRLTAPALKWRAQALQDTSFDASLVGMRMYHDKGWGVRGHDEPHAASQSDEVFGDAGADTLSGGNAVAVVPMWRPTNTLVDAEEVEPRRSFLSALDSREWARLREYEVRDRTFDGDVLSGGAEAGERDVSLVEDLQHDRVTDKERWTDSVYYRPAYPYVAGALRDTYVRAANGTCLNELQRDGVIATAAVHTHIPFPVYGWHGLFGVVWGSSGVHEPQYYLHHHDHVNAWNNGNNAARDGSDAHPCLHHPDTWECHRTF